VSCISYAINTMFWPELSMPQKAAQKQMTQGTNLRAAEPKTENQSIEKWIRPRSHCHVP